MEGRDIDRMLLLHSAAVLARLIMIDSFVLSDIAPPGYALRRLTHSNLRLMCEDFSMICGGYF
jgi:hypothetical protein